MQNQFTILYRDKNYFLKVYFSGDISRCEIKKNALVVALHNIKSAKSPMQFDVFARKLGALNLQDIPRTAQTNFYSVLSKLLMAAVPFFGLINIAFSGDTLRFLNLFFGFIFLMVCFAANLLITFPNYMIQELVVEKIDSLKALSLKDLLREPELAQEFDEVFKRLCKQQGTIPPKFCFYYGDNMAKLKPPANQNTRTSAPTIRPH